MDLKIVEPENSITDKKIENKVVTHTTLEIPRQVIQEQAAQYGKIKALKKLKMDYLKSEIGQK